MSLEEIQEKIESELKQDDVTYVNIKHTMAQDPYVGDLITYIHSSDAVKKIVKKHVAEFGEAIVQPIYCNIFGVSLPSRF